MFIVIYLYYARGCKGNGSKYVIYLIVVENLFNLEKFLTFPLFLCSNFNQRQN